MPLPASSPQNPKNSLSPEDIQKLTSDLSQEIDQEIKKQLSEPHPFANNQTQTDQNVSQTKILDTDQAKDQEPNSSPTLSPNLQPKTGSSSVLPPSETDPTLANLDPLQASLNSALTNLKEGDKIGTGWVLKKIFSTSFGNNRSLFYELENEAGAKWTLSPEEMRDVLRSNVKNEKEPADLSPKPSEIEMKTPENKKNITEEISSEAKSDKSKEASEKNLTTDSTELTKEQIDFVSKLHSDSKQWQAFTSFTTAQLEAIQTLYEKGQLTRFGIDAHPLLDKINSKALGKEVEIGSEDSFTTLVEKEGHPLDYSSKDSVLLGLHILLNTDLLAATIKKAESAGLIVEKLPQPKDTINLVKDSIGGNNSAYSKLLKILQFLPSNSKFRILSTKEVSDLEKYFD